MFVCYCRYVASSKGTCIYVSRLNAITVSVLICKIIIHTHTKKGVIESVGLNNSGLLLWVEVWIVVGQSGRGSGWSWGESWVGTWARLEAGVGLNSGGEGLRLTIKLSLRGMQGVTERNNLNWLFGVSCMEFGLSSSV